MDKIIVAFESEKSGAALCFKAPETGYYDYGYIFARTTSSARDSDSANSFINAFVLV